MLYCEGVWKKYPTNIEEEKEKGRKIKKIFF